MRDLCVRSWLGIFENLKVDVTAPSVVYRKKNVLNTPREWKTGSFAFAGLSRPSVHGFFSLCPDLFLPEVPVDASALITFVLTCSVALFFCRSSVSSFSGALSCEKCIAYTLCLGCLSPGPNLDKCFLRKAAAGTDALAWGLNSFPFPIQVVSSTALHFPSGADSYRHVQT